VFLGICNLDVCTIKIFRYPAWLKESGQTSAYHRLHPDRDDDSVNLELKDVL
jgi:hypothetical protein